MRNYIDTIHAFILVSIHNRVPIPCSSPATTSQVFYNTQCRDSRVVDSARCRSSIAVGQLRIMYKCIRVVAAIEINGSIRMHKCIIRECVKCACVQVRPSVFKGCSSEAKRNWLGHPGVGRIKRSLLGCIILRNKSQRWKIRMQYAYILTYTYNIRRPKTYIFRNI